MQLIGYSAPQVDVSAVPGLGGVLSWTESTVRQTARRAVALASLIDRVGSTLDDVAELRRAAEIIAANLSELGASAAGIDRNAGKIAEEISGLSTAAQGIDIHAEKLAKGIDELVAILPTLQRLTEIVDPLDNTVMRLGRFVDRLPGGRRTQNDCSADPRQPAVLERHAVVLAAGFRGDAPAPPSDAAPRDRA